MMRRCLKMLGIATVAVFAGAVPVLDAFAAFGFTSESSFTAQLRRDITWKISTPTTDWV